MAFTTLNATSPDDFMGGESKSSSTMFDADYVKSTDTYQNMQGRFSFFTGCTVQIAGGVALGAVAYFAAPVLASGALYMASSAVPAVVPLNFVLQPATSAFIMAGILGLGVMPVMEMSFAFGEEVGKNTCDQVVDQVCNIGNMAYSIGKNMAYSIGNMAYSYAKENFFFGKQYWNA